MVTPSHASNMSPPLYRYQVGGSLGAQSLCYVERPADNLLYNALAAGEFCYVLNSRQMGKSSLLVRTKQRLERQGIRCAALDLTSIGGLDATPTQWYKGLLVQICLSLKLVPKINVKAWWKDHEDLPLAQRITLFIREVLLNHIPEQPIVILVDEIDTVLGLPFSSDDFFALIRFCFNQRSLDPHFTRITFALFGVATPASLIQDPQRTPFNIGRAIPLTGFSLSQADPLMKGLPIPYKQAVDSLKAIFQWTGGQPFLTQKLCKKLCEKLCEELDKKLDSHPDSHPSRPISEIVEHLVNTEIIQNWKAQDEPEHLSTIANRILSNPRTASRLLGIYQHILANGAIAFDHSPEQIELRLSGLVTHQNDQLQIKNRIYTAVFTSQWAQQKLEQLRPYSVQLNRWLTLETSDQQQSDQQQSDHLLQGLALKEALAWAQDKQLSDIDYRFLAESQTLERQMTQQALAAEQQERELAEQMVISLQSAAHLFAHARQTAKRRSRTLKIGRKWIAAVASGVTGSVLLLRLTGLLQGLEWAAFDRLQQQQIAQQPDPRITLVTVDEADIQAAGQFPLSGQVLADLIQQLDQHQPRGIGLDIYRDVPVEPGHDAFLQAVARSPHIVGVEQLIDNPIAAPPGLTQPAQIGFADQVVDGDGTIRRALLSIPAGQGESPHFSFAFTLALKYLAAEGITPVSIKSGWNQLGQAVLKPFNPATSGFYVRAEDGGYQMLINYYGTEASFQQIPLREIMAGKLDAELVRDRLILIGMTAESVNDLFPSPYSQRLFGSAKPMAGVTVHANIVSQLLSAALEGRPLLRVWPQWLEWLWIGAWSGIGALLSWKTSIWKTLIWQRYRWVGRLVVLAMAVGGLVGMAMVALAYGWWIPLMPALLALVGTAVVLPSVMNWQLDQWRLRETVNILVAEARKDAVVGEIAIAYLKQVAGQESRRLGLIEKYLSHANVAMATQDSTHST